MKSILKSHSDKNTIDLEDARTEYMKREKEIIVGNYTLPSKPCKDGYYRVYVSDKQAKNGRRRQLSAKTIEQLADKIYQHEKGIDGCAKKTFSDVFYIVETEKLRYIKNKEKLLSAQNTASKHQFEYNRFFKGTPFESMFIDEIDKRDIENIIILNLQKYDLNKKAFDGMISIIRGVFKLAYYEYWISDNVFLRIDLRKFSGMLAETTPASDRAYSEKELSQILDYIRQYQQKAPDYLPAYALEIQIIMGLRRGEIPPLMWSDIHDGCISINKEQITVKTTTSCKQHCIIVNHTKTYKNRLFPVTNDIDLFLKKLRKVHSSYNLNSLYLFPYATSTGVISNSIVYSFYARVIDNLGLKKKDLIMGPHSFRRNAITDVVNASNGNMTLASQLFGNSPLVANQNYYTGVDMNSAITALNSRKLS